MRRYRVPRPDQMRPDWGVDPDVDEDFPDDATIARDLEEDRRRLLPPPNRGSGNMWPMIVVALILASPVGSMVSARAERLEWVRLVQAGGGETYHLVADALCRASPVLSRSARVRNLGRPVQIGTAVDVVARASDWALIDRYGHPCWVPTWALSRTAPDMRAIRKCGRSCHLREPAGWAAAQQQAACRYSLIERARCLGVPL